MHINEWKNVQKKAHPRRVDFASGEGVTGGFSRKQVLRRVRGQECLGLMGGEHPGKEKGGSRTGPVAVPTCKVSARLTGSPEQRAPMRAARAGRK